MDPISALYGDPSQLRALYSDSSNRTNAWIDQKGTSQPQVPLSARSAAALKNPTSARILAAKSSTQSARAPGPQNPGKYGIFVAQPATARAKIESKRPAEIKDPRQPASARPLTTPRISSTTTPSAETLNPYESPDGPYIPPPGTRFEYDGGSSIVLSPHTEPPTQKEINDYAIWLGIDIEQEKELLWLAKEALRAPLPPYWRPCNTQDGDVYYFNFATGDSLWDHPMDALFRRLVPMEKERLQQCRSSGEPYEVTTAYIQATIGAFMAHLCPVDINQLQSEEYAVAATSEAEPSASDGPCIPQPGTVFQYEGGGFSTVLEDNADTYTPSQSEIQDYARWLGIDVDRESELLWIANDGLTTPLPDPWRPCKTNTGDLYYFNFGSGESSWEHPMDEFFKTLVVLERDRLNKCRSSGQQYTRSR